MKTKRIILAGALIMLSAVFLLGADAYAQEVTSAAGENPITLDATPFLFVSFFASASLAITCVVLSLKSRR